MEVQNKNLYIWGATDASRRTGRCKECYEFDGYLSLLVDKNNFAKPGDSGALVCVGDNIDSCMAAFILVGADVDNKDLYLVFKVSEAIDKIAEKRSEMKPFVCHKVMP